jgi:hypothetical protein
MRADSYEQLKVYAMATLYGAIGDDTLVAPLPKTAPPSVYLTHHQASRPLHVGPPCRRQAHQVFMAKTPTIFWHPHVEEND